MITLQSISDKLKSIDLVGFALSVIDEEQLEEMKDRLSEGELADGSLLPEYSPVTISIKQETGGFISGSGRIGLKDTGDFQDSFTIDKKKDFAEIAPTDSKSEKLYQSFGDNITDVSGEEVDNMLDDTREDFIKEVENYLFS